HLCYFLVEQQALFTGDVILAGSTTVIPPADGDLTAYMTSLRRLQQLDVRRIYPAHGPVVEDGPAKIREYIEHRLLRERQILEVVGEGRATIPGIVEKIYAEVSPAVHPLESAPRRDPDLVGRLVSGRGLAVLEGGPRRARDILTETPGQCDVQHLEPAADREHRQPPRQRVLDQRDFQRVARVRNSAHGFVARLLEEVRVHVPSAGQEHAVKPLEQFSARALVYLWRQQDWHPSRPLDGREVRGVDGGPFTLFAGDDRRAHPDERRACHACTVAHARGS